MRQYLNRFTRETFVIDDQRITDAYYIYRVTAPISDRKEFWRHISGVRDKIRADVKPFGSTPGDEKTECYFVSETPINRTDVTIQRVGSSMFQRLPLYIQGNLLLTIAGFSYSDYVTDFLLPLPVKAAEGEVFCQRFTFRKDENHNAVLCMIGKTLTKKDEFKEDELKKLEKEGVQLVSYAIGKGFAYPDDNGEYYGRKVERRSFKRNSLKYAFSMEHIKKTEDIQKQKLPLFLQTYQLLQKSVYVKQMEPDSVEVERSQEGLSQYKDLLQRFFGQIDGKEYSVVFGNSITDTDQDALVDMLNHIRIPELEILNKGGEKAEATPPKFHLRDKPEGMTIYIIDENCSGRSKQQREEHPSEADIDYKQTNVNTDEAIIQHTAYDTLFKVNKQENLEVAVPVLLNLLLQLQIKQDAVSHSLSMMSVPGQYRFYTPHPVYDNKGKLVKTLADVMDYENGQFDYKTGVPLDGYAYPMGRDRMIQYIILQKSGDDPDSWPQLTVSDSDVFAIPKPDIFLDMLMDKTNSQHSELPVNELWRLLNQTYDEVKDEENYEKYSEILENCTKTTVQLSKLKGRNTKFKRVFENKLFEKYGVHLSYSVKSQAYIDENYPAFSQITTCKEGMFVPSFQNPTQGLNSLPTAIHLKKTLWEGGEFKEELLQMLYNPFGKFKQLSFRPLPVKLLKELTGGKEETQEESLEGEDVSWQI